MYQDLCYLRNNSLKKSLIFSFALIGQIGFATAMPLVIFGLLGKYLDKKFDTSPTLFLIGIAIATVQIYFYVRAIVRSNLEELKK